MVKLLRKYNKYILVVGGSLLMIAFLVPQAFNTLLGDPSGMVYARLGDQKITLGEHEQIQREFSALEDFAPGLVRGELVCENAEHWLLLVREARAAGLVAESGDGAAWVELNSALENMLAAEIARSLYQEQAQQKLADPAVRDQCLSLARQRLADHKARAAGQRRLTVTDFDKVLAEARGVFRLRSAFLDAARFSDRRAAMLKAERFEGAVIESVRIPAERIAFAMPEPTPEAVDAQFNKYRDTAPGTGEYGFGYRLDPRLKLEWLTIDRAAIESAVPTDAVEANKRWRNDRKKYPGEFLAEKARAEADIKKERVDKIAADIDVLVRGEFKRAGARLEADGIFRKIPADWPVRRPKLEDVAQSAVKAVKENTGIDIPLPAVTVQSSRWLAEADIYSLPGIGAAQVSLGGGRAVRLAPVLFAAREFNRTDLGGLELPLQVGLTSGELVGSAEGARYYFTILDYRPASAPDSIDEVRDRCVGDLKRLAAFERLKSNIPAFEAMACIGGMEDVKKTIDAEYPLPAPAEPKPGEASSGPEDIQVITRQFLPRFSAGANNPGESPELRARIFAIADALDPTKPISATPASDRIASGEIPRVLTVQIALVVGVQPATFEVIRATGDDRLGTLKREQITGLIQADGALDPFTFETMKARWKFRIEDLADAKPMHLPSPKRN